MKKGKKGRRNKYMCFLKSKNFLPEKGKKKGGHQSRPHQKKREGTQL